MSEELDVVARLEAEIARFEIRLERFHESVDERFDQVIELLKFGFRSLHEQIQSLKRS
jgi:hypothetical protein